MNGFSPILWTLAGIYSSGSKEQEANMPPLIRSVVWGSVTCTSFQHCEKRLSPIVTLPLPDMNRTLTISTQLMNAPAPTERMLAGKSI